MPDLRTALTSALQQAATEWAADDEPHQQFMEKQMQQATPTPTQQTPTPTEPKTVTEATFNMVRDNPGITRMEAVKRLALAGCKESSTSSILAQFMTLGMIEKVNSNLYARAESHKGMTSQKVLAARKKKNAEVKRAIKKSLGEQLRAKLMADDIDTLTNRKPLNTVTVTPPSQGLVGAVGAVSGAGYAPLTVPHAYAISADSLAAKSAKQILMQFNIVQAREVYDELKKIFGG